MTAEAAIPTRYPLSMRALHWLRAVLVCGLILIGWYMTGLPDDSIAKFAFFYPNHKQFGLLAWIVALAHLLIRWSNRRRLPEEPDALQPWEKLLSHMVHRLLIALTVLIPLLGYSMSASFTQSDGVPFFFTELPELLPKNDTAFVLFQALHKYGAYALLILVMLHVAGAMKHRITDRNGATDVLPRML
ncbi:cytochrome b [Novosphingobium jiangmenense]|uniref:Cytochrome b n=1 Tax=Novosphingobium jiangmenense TaxID=2791981 RepID=A0ABS0HBH2_9SPHN|nr:cytochrome b [Novosphingobium jiangmenense]MBF9149629.1 cytochrome b [Novosphingobium jiangmenense]